MGVFIRLNMMPYHIREDEWKEVYEETLELIRAFPFLDTMYDKETYNCVWKYLDRTEERNIPYADDQLGWHTVGDELSLKLAESFYLIKDLNYYRETCPKRGNCNDILFSESVLFPIEHNDLRVADVRVFDSKTQGEPFHIPLLAIACLIENRFPRYAIVHGDVTIGQMKRAVEWANSILKKPIAVTERAKNRTLLKRVKTEVQDDRIALESFMELVMQDVNIELGGLIREEFKPETLRAYFISRFSDKKIGTIGFSWVLNDYFSLGYRIEDACKICVLDVDGCHYDAEAFVRAVLSLEWAEEESLDNIIPLGLNKPDTENPETVSSQLGKSILQMAGFQESVKSSLTQYDVAQALREILGTRFDINALIDELLAKKKEEAEKSEALFAELRKELEEMGVEAKDSEDMVMDSMMYDITDIDELIGWKKGDTIVPGLEKGIVNVKDFVDKLFIDREDIFTRFHSQSEREKIRELIHHNQYFYLHKKVWEIIFSNVHNPQFVNKVLGIFFIKAEEITINKLCKALLNNQGLFEEYMM